MYYIKPEGKESKPTNQPELMIDYTKPQNLIKPIIYEYDPEERARQSAEMKRILQGARKMSDFEEQNPTFANT